MSLNQWLANVKITRELAVGFGAVLFLVVVATVLSVLRFKEIRDVYEKTNLIYNINTRIYQAKIARVKYLNGDDQAGKNMAYLIKNASELATRAAEMLWSQEEKGLISTISGYLNDFQTNIGVMQKAAAELSEMREALDKLAADDLAARYAALIRDTGDNSALLAQISEQLLTINSLRAAAIVVRYNPTKAAVEALNLRFATAQNTVLALIPQQPAQTQRQM
jgi:methyl-accepting chemotaxis protein-2 (aspartate sensor receptor)